MPQRRQEQKVVSWYVSDEVHRAIRVRVAKLGISRQDWLEGIISEAIEEDLEDQKKKFPPELPEPEQIDQAIDILRKAADLVANHRDSVSESFILKILDGTLTLSDLNRTARALEVDPNDLQKIKKCENGEYQNVADRACQ